MIESPFSLFASLPRPPRICLLTKADDVKSNADVARTIGRPVDQLAAVNQVHGNRVIRVHGPMNGEEEADGLVTDVANLTLKVRMADCQTFVYWAPKHSVIGALHVGWKGLIAGGVESMFDVLRNEWGIEGSDVWVGAGPSLCMKCADFTDPMRELPGIPSRFFDGLLVDLCGYGDFLLQEGGVPASQRQRHPGCTRCDPGAFWTYRGGHRDEVRAGHTNALTIEIPL